MALNDELDYIEKLLGGSGQAANTDTATLQALKQAYGQTMAPVARPVVSPFETMAAIAAPMTGSGYGSPTASAATIAGKVFQGFGAGAAMRRGPVAAPPNIDQLKTTAEIMKLMREKQAMGGAPKLENPWNIALGLKAQDNITLKRKLAQYYGKQAGASPEELQKIDLQIMAESKKPALQDAIDEMLSSTDGKISAATYAKLQAEGSAKDFNDMVTQFKKGTPQTPAPADFGSYDAGQTIPQ